MAKVLVTILHYNSPRFTDVLYRQLKPYEREDYDLLVIDNGSEPGRSSRYAGLVLPENLFFGGGLNLAFELVRKQPEYEALFFLNSDLIVHGFQLVRLLWREMCRHQLTLLSPAVMYPHEFQWYQRQMFNWGSAGTRPVRCMDFQCPLIHRRLIEAVPVLPKELCLGWGLDFLLALACLDRNWQMGVTDLISVIHYGGGTIRDNQHRPELQEFHIKADQQMQDYLPGVGLKERVDQLLQWAMDYQFEPDDPVF